MSVKNNLKQFEVVDSKTQTFLTKFLGGKARRRVDAVCNLGWNMSGESSKLVAYSLQVVAINTFYWLFVIYSRQLICSVGCLNFLNGSMTLTPLWQALEGDLLSESVDDYHAVVTVIRR